MGMGLTQDEYIEACLEQRQLPHDYIIKPFPTEGRSDKGFARRVFTLHQVDGGSPFYPQQQLAEFLSPVREDRELVLAAVEQNPGNLKHAADTLRNDPAFIEEVIKTSPMALEHAGGPVLRDRDFMLKAITGNPDHIRCLHQSLENDVQIARAYFQQLLATVGEPDPYTYNGIELDRFGPAVKDDKEAVSLAVQYDPNNLAEASPRLKDDLQVALPALEKDKHAVRNTGPTIKTLCLDDEGRFKDDPAKLVRTMLNMQQLQGQLKQRPKQAIMKI